MSGGRGGEANAKGWRERAEIIQGGKGGERQARNAALVSTSATPAATLALSGRTQA